MTSRLLLRSGCLLLVVGLGCREPVIEPSSTRDIPVDDVSQQDHVVPETNARDAPQANPATQGDSQEALDIDIGKEGVDVEVGDAVDVTAGDEGVDVDVDPQRSDQPPPDPDGPGSR